MERRTFIKAAVIAAVGPATASMVASGAVAQQVTASPLTTALSVLQRGRGGEIFAAYRQMLEARDELAAANSALEWLADEWRHVWPLAPEEILDLPRAEGRYGMVADRAERDILGRPIMRDTAGLTKWAKFSQTLPSTCFSIETSERLERRLAHLTQQVPKGRTEKALARNAAHRDACVTQTRRALQVAKWYEGAIVDIRNEAGVAQTQKRVADAKVALAAACAAISSFPVNSMEGLRIKVEALQLSAPGFLELADVGGLAPVGRILRDIMTFEEA